MGGGSYDFSSATTRSYTAGYATKSVREVFKSRDLDSKMNPKSQFLREARDSDEHPTTVPIIIALDVTGSMGQVPHLFVRDGLTETMKGLKVDHPALMFMAIGDHECDRAPLQIAQFEASDKLLDQWLTTVFVESGGGGNDGESYLLAWYYAAYHTSIDSFEKRGKKGFLFTIGDEPTLREISGEVLADIMGTQKSETKTAVELLDEARKMYNVYHLHISQGHNGSRKDVVDGWRQLMGDNVVCVQSHEQLPGIIADIISRDTDKTSTPSQSGLISEAGSKVEEEMML